MMQSAQYGNGSSDKNTLGNMPSDLSMSAGWAPGTLPYETAPLPQQNDLFSDYAFSDMSFPADEPCFASVSGVSQANFTGTSSSPVTTAPGNFHPPTFNAIRLSRDVKETISPLQTSFNHQDLHSNSGTASGTSEPQSAISSHTDPFSSQPASLSSHTSSSSSQSTDGGHHRRNHSLPSLRARSHDDQKPRSPISGPSRCRKYLAKDTDPVRALYLEKNRIAASKCRNRQKRQEEKLVEKARGIERLNKDLKCEVQLLKESMRHLMEDVGQHTTCSDNRLATYVQRKADCLAVGDAQLSSVKTELDADCDRGWKSSVEE